MRPNRLKSALILLIPLATLSLIFYFPLFELFREGLTFRGNPTFRLLQRLLSDPYYHSVIKFTVKQAMLSTLLSLLIGLPWAWILTRYRFPGRKIIKSLTIVPFVLPSITVVSGFIAFYGNNGYLNNFLMNLLNTDSPPLRILYSLRGILLAHAFYNAPIITRIVNARWEDIGPAYRESARSLGAGRARSFWDITVPLLAPSVAAGSALAFIFSFLSFPIILTLGGARFSTLEVEIYTLVDTLGKYKLGAALALIETLLSLIFFYLYLRIESSFTTKVKGSKQRRRKPLIGAGTVEKLLSIPFIIFSAVFFGGPVISVIHHSLKVGKKLGFKWYEKLFSPDYQAIIGAAPLGSVVNSLLFALGTVFLAGIIGLSITYFTSREGISSGAFLESLIMVPLGISSVALGYAIFEGFTLGPLSNLPRWLLIIFAHSILAYPFFLRTLAPALRSFDRSLLEAARGLGAGRWRALWEIEIPLLKSHLLVGAMFAFAISLGEMSATIMLIKPGLKTIPVTIYNLIGARQFGQASAMSVLLMAIVGISFVSIDRWGENVFHS